MGQRAISRKNLTTIAVLVILGWALTPGMSSQMEAETGNLDTTQFSQSSESTYLLDVGYAHESVNAMAYSPDGDLVVGGVLCGLYYVPEDPDDCQITIDGAEVVSTDFAPAYLLTLDSTGNTKDIQIISSSGGDRVDSISFAQNGDMLVGGSACWLGPSGCTLSGFGISLPAVNDNGDAWFARIGPGGEAQWSMLIGSEGFDTIHSIAESPDGSIYVAGTFCQDYNLLCRITIGDTMHQSKGGADVMIAKLSPQGDVLWSKTFGSGTSDTDMWNSWYSLSQKGIVATPDGGLIVSGWGCEGWDANCVMTIETGYSVSNHNTFILKYSANGTIERLTVMNGDGADFVQVMIPVDDERILLAGNHYSSRLFAGSFSVYNSGGSDAWYSIFNHSSWSFEALWDSKTEGNEVFHSAVVTPEGHYVLGGTQCWGGDEVDCPVTFETQDGMEVTRNTKSGGGEGFLMLHDSEWNSIAWIKGISENEAGVSYLGDLAISQTGNIAANFPVCVTNNNTGCSAGVGGDAYSSVVNGTMIYQITFDADGDGVSDADDLCLVSPETGWTSNAQTDFDGDGCRDADQDLDDDGDGSPDDLDLFPLNPMEWMDTDSDGVGDNQDLDDDSDGWLDSTEADCGGTDSKDPSSTPSDTDGDGQCDHIDSDDDGDDVEDALDAFPLEICASLDRDLDGKPDQFTIPNCPTSLVLDYDDDNDGVSDLDDLAPLDDKVGGDSDGDGKPDWILSGAPSTYTEDTDDDNDGIPDIDDAFPLIPTESVDTDGDGIGDNTDSDDDGDGWSDIDESICGSDSLVLTDIPADDDGDGICDSMETSSVNIGGVAGLAGIAMLLIILGVLVSMLSRKQPVPLDPPSPPPPPALDDED